MKNELVGISVGIVCAIVLIGTVLVPLVDDVTAETLIYENDGTTYAEYDDEEHTIVLERVDGELTITTDGEVCENPDFTLYSAATLVYGSDGMLRLLKGSGNNDNLHIFTDSSSYLAIGQNETVTVTVASAGVTMVKDSTTKSGTFTPLAYISSEGDYVLSENPCVTTESTIYLAGQTVIDSSNSVVFFGNGTIESVTASSGYIVSEDSLTVSSVSAVANTSEIAGNLVQIDSVVFTATMSDDSEWTGTYTYFLAPSEVEYDNPNYVGDNESVLFGIIPLFLILAVLCAVVYAVMRNRD